MFFFYVDEAGNPDPHHVPILSGETPLFCLSAIAIHETSWRLLSRDHHRLKQRFFRNEIGSGVPLEYEVKGSELTRPGNRGNRRNHAYLAVILSLCQDYKLPFFSIVIRKNSSSPANATSIYTMSLQYLMERFQDFLDETNDSGLVIVDSRKHHLDLQVARSCLSYIFGNVRGRQFNRLVEAPMFADSRMTSGLQVVDIVGSCIYDDAYYWRCRSIPGALDYSHMRRYRPSLLQREFHSAIKHRGYYTHGFRHISHYQPAATTGLKM